MGKMSMGMRVMAMTRAQQGGNQMRMGDQPEMRRQRDSRGRFMEGGTMAYEGGQGNYSRTEGPQNHWQEPNIHPYLERPGMNRRMEGEAPYMGEEPDGQNPYGGNPEVYERQKREKPEMRGGNISYRKADGSSGNVSYFRTQAHHSTDPLNQRGGMERMERMEKPRQIGFQQSEGEGLDKQTVMEWVEEMHDGKGLRGGHFTWHQAQQHAMNKGITGQQRQLEFFWAINAMYTDYHTAAEKFGVDKPEFYACLAKLFIEDPDAVDDKVEMYNRYIVKRDE